MSTRQTPKIVIVGGGSNIWSPYIVKDMLLHKDIQDSKFVLYDIDKKASDLCKTFLDKLSEQLSIKAEFVSTDDRVAAFKDATHFVITISTGGLDSMEYDLDIPEKYGIYHTVGDTCGPGGWARTIRNFGAFVDIANAINELAPRAMILNYSNPMPTLTDVLTRLCKGQVVGLCHGLFENIYFLQHYYGLKDESEIVLKYAGLNHFFWITEAYAGKVNVIADLNKKLKKKSLSDLLPQIHKDPVGYSSGRDVADELFRLTGIMPYLGDRHTSEYFPWYITSKINMKNYRIQRTSIKTRRERYRQRDAKLKKMIKETIEKSYFESSRESAANIIAAHRTGKTFSDVGNMANQGQVSNLPLNCVVETSIIVDNSGISPVSFGELPEPILSFVKPWATVYTMIIDACFQKNKKMAIEALRLDPLCSHLNCKQVNDLGNELLMAHRKFISWK